MALTKQILRKRLSVAIDHNINTSDFSWFFARFCEATNRPDLRTVKQLSCEDITLFSKYCGYDLNFPIPLPLWAQI